MFEAKLAGLAQNRPIPRDFDLLPADAVLRAFGVEYGHIRPPEGGDLYVTRFGWRALPHVLPSRWYADEWYARSGARLLGGTGNVYRVRTRPVDGRSTDIVVKFSRMAQDVPVEVRSTFPDDLPPEVLAAARVNSPLEEFGLLMELRNATPENGPASRVLTQRPFAIFAPPEEFPLWQLGRDEGRFHVYRRTLEDDQRHHPKAIELDIRRIYVLLYGWVEGRDAEEVLDAGELDDAALQGLTVRVIDDLQSRGYRVLDNKPKHFILRSRKSGGLLRRDGKLVYALVDFEFLQRTSEHQRRFRLARRRRYWEHIARERPHETALPSHLQRADVFGVPYLYGTSPDGGRAWVAGHTLDLFDYFAPERWRRTPRVKLSPTSEVYRTRTKDGIHLVYRLSRVGMRPRCDPLTPEGKRIRAHGYNSPFEEVALARRIRAAGMRTVHPRAIYRTGHRSMRAVNLRDERRFETHASLTAPGPVPEPLLSPTHDYYTIWGYFRGIDPAEGGLPKGVIDVLEARELGFLDDAELATVTERVQSRLGHPDTAVELKDTTELVVALGADGTLLRDEHGALVVSTSIDVNTAYDHGLLDEAACRRAIDRFDERLHAVGFERLDKSGSDLLLSMRPDGSFARESDGELQVTLCNLELVRALS